MKLGKTMAIFAIFLALISFSAFAIAPGIPGNGAMHDVKEKVMAGLEKAKEKFNQAKERFESQKDRWDDAKMKWQLYKNEWQLGKNKDKNRLFSGAKNYMVKATERMQNYLEMTEARAQKIQDLPESDLNSITAQINAELSKLDALKTRINDANSNEEIRALVPEVNAEWNSVKAFSKKITGLILSANTQKSVNASEKIVEKAEERLNALDQNAIDTNSARAALEEMKAHIELAKQKKAEAVVKFLQISYSNNAQSLFKEGHGLLKEAQKELRNCHNSLKKVILDVVKEKNRLRERDRAHAPEDLNESEDENGQD